MNPPWGCWSSVGSGRLAISLFMLWRLRQPKPHQESLTNFQSLMGGNNLASALFSLTSKSPKLP